MNTKRTMNHDSYDVIIIGGAMLGASVAWFLTDNPDFDGRVLVVERDPTYEFASTSHTNSCMRQQFGRDINIRVSQFAAEYVKNFRAFMGNDPRVPNLHFHNFGYLYLADTEDFAQTLKKAHQLQVACGAGTRLLTPEDLAQEFPFYDLDGILCATHNTADEGYFDGATMLDWWRRSARERRVEFIADEVVDMTKSANTHRVESVTLKSGRVVTSGTVVNASGPRAAATARMAGIEIPVEPRKRYTYVFAAETPLDRDLPLTIDPTGVHVRTDGAYYMAGAAPDDDFAVDYDDFQEDHSLWQDKVWPIIATRIPQFEAIKVINSWVGHYAYNTFDQNAILGVHPDVENLVYVNGFSGHGFQQAPAMGRGVAELITYGEFRALDLSPFNFDRIIGNLPFVERAVI